MHNALFVRQLSVFVAMEFYSANVVFDLKVRKINARAKVHESPREAVRGVPSVTMPA